MNLVQEFRSWRCYRTAAEQLERLSDRELADIGVMRGDIRRAVRRK